MKKRAIAYMMLAVMMAVIASCSTDRERLRRAAEKSYEYLQKGKYEKFVGEIAYADSMSDDYRAQMIDLVHEYAAALQERHGGLTDITAVGDTIVGDQAHVYLQVTFADSTSEAVGVPMVRVGKKWKMQ